MKRILLLLAFAGTVAAAQAQTKFGAKGGLNVNNFGGADVNRNKANIGFHLGAYADFTMTNKVSIQPELLYSAQGVTWKNVGPDSRLNFGYLNIPVMVKYQIVDGFHAEVGPQFGFLLSAKAKTDGNKTNIKKSFKTFDLGLGIGAGYQIPSSPVGLGLRYNLGLSRLDKDGDLKWFNRVLQASIYYELGRGK